jgi:Flp pilus assembly protein TadD
MRLIMDLEACEQAVKEAPESAGARLDLAAALMSNQRPVEAAAESREAVRLRPDWPDAHVSLGFSELVVGNAAEARVAFDRAVELDPEQGMAQFGLVQSLALTGDLAAARERFAHIREHGSVPEMFIEQLGQMLDAAVGPNDPA